MRLFNREVTPAKLRSFLRKFKFSLVIIPEEHSSVFPTITLKFYRSLIILTAIAVLAFLFSVLIVINTSVRYYVFDEKVQLTHKQVREIDDLTKKVQQLLQEIEKQKKLNELMRNAILRGDSSAFKNKNITDGGFLAKVFWEWLENGILKSNGKKAQSMFIKPSNTGISSQGFSPHGGHFGIDYSMNTGNNILAAGGGYVVFADYTVNDGFMVILAHSGGYISVYKHCSVIFVSAMEKVKQGSIIALSGSTGKLSGGPHLHFELWKDGTPINPAPLLSD